MQTSTCYSQRFHVPTEMNPVFITKQNECAVCCSFVHPVKVPVHKIQFCFTSCIVEYVNLICLTVTAGVAVVLRVLAVTQTHSLAFQIVPEIFLEMLPLWLHSVLSTSSSLISCLLCSFNLQNQTYCLKPFHLFIPCFTVWRGCKGFFSSKFTDSLPVVTAFVNCVIHTSP